jgi:CRP-like cAMP-binding protein
VDAEDIGGARSRLLELVPSPDREVAAEILAACRTVDVVAGEPYFHSSLPAGALLIVERGFVVLRVTPPRTNRSIVTCDAGLGRLVLPPASEEVLFALVDSQLTVISPNALDALLALPGVAKTMLEQLTVTLGQKQQAIGAFGSTRHIERLRGKLLQLARIYGRVALDGVRIDFPLSHTLLADMVGSSRETVTRSLDELRRDGFVARQGQSYRLLVSPDCVALAPRP